MICSREVFKAKEKKNPKKVVAMKKVLMDNEKEGVGRTIT
jgi:cyclin-dependent kinase 9